jgi:hypothetical protein
MYHEGISGVIGMLETLLYHTEKGIEVLNGVNEWLIILRGIKLYPIGLRQAVVYFEEQLGFWKLLTDMLSVQTTDRVATPQVLHRRHVKTMNFTVSKLERN